MSDVSFEEEKTYSPQTSYGASNQSAITKLVISFGLAKSESEAQKVLLGIIAISLITAVAIVLFANKKPKPVLLPDPVVQINGGTY